MVMEVLIYERISSIEFSGKIDGVGAEVWHVSQAFLSNVLGC